MLDPLVSATLELLQAIQTHLRPAPNKLLNIFTVRDLSQIQQGLLLANPETIKTQDQLVRLWCHEVLRVFHDRLADDKDRSWCKQLVKQMTEKHFHVNFTETFKHLDLDGNGDIDEEELRYIFSL